VSGVTAIGQLPFINMMAGIARPLFRLPSLRLTTRVEINTSLKYCEYFHKYLVLRW
jgi:hypothetical protein